MIQVKDQRVKFVFAVIGFGIFIHFSANFTQMAAHPDYFVGSVVIPLIFLIMATLFIKESMYFLMIPLLAYFSERLFNLFNFIEYFSNEASLRDVIGIDTLFLYTYLIRVALGITISLLIVFAITSKSQKAWSRSHQLTTILLILHGIQLLTMPRYREADLFIRLLQVPNMMYFSVIAFVITHPKYYWINFDQQFNPYVQSPLSFSQNGFSQPGSVASRPGLSVAPSAPVKQIICPQCAANNKPGNDVCHQCGGGLNGVLTLKSAPAMPKPPRQTPSSGSPSATPSTLLSTCPECKQSNSGSTYCLNCGHSLTVKGRVQ